ncbi:four-helix bundle copper-binding protein [Jeotgalibaca ciconiae]|uniref:Four-helix bundle copper-binding protein n=1 Tax=Jeotgalibaca ciconiae TaxID=2496265 RepID=A0A3S9H9A9_9LACT|nr:four-helix bundle copper-binding protein [Jeotgalibaca ciconiae]AZP03948.1 four-helix bundle copper-binding protein [Jeotgalibaca ciconiae]HJB23976.1 four-helix bundle copper-binding protein [Candidatus Jeotgalibaca pullicola]
MEESVKDLMQKLTDCITACNHCFDQCLQEDDVKHMTECIRTDRECADICTIALSFLTREGSLKADLLQLCAITCQACGDECEKHSHDHCQECAKACFACAEACRTHPLIA